MKPLKELIKICASAHNFDTGCPGNPLFCHSKAFDAILPHKFPSNNSHGSQPAFTGSSFQLIWPFHSPWSPVAAQSQFPLDFPLHGSLGADKTNTVHHLHPATQSGQHREGAWGSILSQMWPSGGRLVGFIDCMEESQTVA